MGQRLRWFGITIGMVATACRGPGDLSTVRCDLVAETASLDFGGVCLAKPATRAVTLRNEGQAACDVTGMTLAGPDAALFTLPPTSSSLTIAAGDSKSLSITFQTDHYLSASAVLEVTTPTGTEQVPLLGQGARLPTTASLALSCPGDRFGQDPCVQGSGSTIDYLFSQTLAGGQAALALTVTNRGCQPLTLSASPFAAAGPFILGGGVTSWTIPEGGGTASLPITFSPTSAGDFDDTLILTSNDPSRSSVSLHLHGPAVTAPFALVTDSLVNGICDFRTLQGTCTGSFQIVDHSDGSTPLTILSVGLATPDPLYTVTRPAADRITVRYDPTQTAALPQALRDDQLVVVTNLGTLSQPLRGGAPAVLDPTPAATLDLGQALTSGVTPPPATLQVDNTLRYNGQPPLLVSQLALATGRDFALTPCPSQPLQPGTPLSVGGTANVCVRLLPSATTPGIHSDRLLLTSNAFPATTEILVSAFVQ